MRLNDEISCEIFLCLIAYFISPNATDALFEPSKLFLAWSKEKARDKIS